MEPASLSDGPTPAMTRLFVALWPAPGTRRALAARRDAAGLAATARPVADAKLHLTLHFIGAVPTRRVARLADTIGLAPPSFTLRLERLEVWPRGLLVLQPAQPPPQLHDLHAALARALVRAGLPVERQPLRPHVTLARRAGPAQAARVVAPVDWVVSGYVLVRSGADGRYTIVRRYPAVGGDAASPMACASESAPSDQARPKPPTQRADSGSNTTSAKSPSAKVCAERGKRSR